MNKCRVTYLSQTPEYDLDCWIRYMDLEDETGNKITGIREEFITNSGFRYRYFIDGNPDPIDDSMIEDNFDFNEPKEVQDIRRYLTKNYDEVELIDLIITQNKDKIQSEGKANFIDFLEGLKN